MDDTTLKAILGDSITRAMDFKRDKLMPDRLKADKYYRGEPFGNEVKGESQVVSRDVAEAVDAMLPSLLKIFSSGPPVQFEPTKPGMEEAALQATEYVGYLWNVKNPGFSIFYDWFKDALMKKRGIVKVWKDEAEKVDTSYYQGLTQAEIDLLKRNPAVSLDVEDAGDGLFDVTLRHTKVECEIRVANVPHDEFLIEATTGNTDDARFVAHRVMRSVSDMVAMGHDREVLDKISGEEDMDDERMRRFSRDGNFTDFTADVLDDTLRMVEITECYTHIDYDDDGIAEMRKITVAGSGTVMEILDNEPVDDHPFATLCPFPVPHAFWGESVFDKTRDVQEGKSVLTRQILNNLYLTNQPRFGVVDGQVNIEDMLTSQNQIIRMTNQNAIVPIQTRALDSGPYNMLQMWDVTREQRTGVRRMASGPGADSLQNAYTDTLGGSQMVADASAERIELIARTFAETGVKRAMRLILKLVTQYDNKPKIVMLRGKWTPINPAEWDDGMDMSISVGLGSGSHQKDAATMVALLGLDQQLIALQGGVDGPLVTLDNMYSKLSRLVSASGLKAVERYYSDPKTAPPKPPQQPPVDPAMVLAQAQMKIDQDKLAADMQKHRDNLEAEMQRFAAEMQMKRAVEAEKTAVTLEKARIDSETDVRTTMLKLGADDAAIAAKHSHEAGLAGMEQGMPYAHEAMALQMAEVAAALERLGQMVAEQTAFVTAPKTIVRDENGMARAIRVEGYPERPIARDEAGNIMGVH